MSKTPNQPMDEDAFQQAFLRAFRRAAAQRGLSIVQWLDDGVECRDAQGETSTLGLQNIARTCRQHEPADWPDIIAHFLQNVGPGELDELPDDLDAVADQVLPRLGAPLSSPDAQERIWWKKLDPERVWLNLVIDYPTRMAYVTREMMERSGKTGA